MKKWKPPDKTPHSCTKMSMFKNISIQTPLKVITRTKFTGNIVTSPSGNVIIPEVSVIEWVLSKMEKFYKYQAVECAETGKKYTFEQIRVKSENLGKALRKNWRLKSGDVVAIHMANYPDFIVSCLGILEAGLVVTPLNSTYKTNEISKQLQDSSAKVIITQPQNISYVKMACQSMSKKLPIISIKIKENDNLPEGVINFEELVNKRIDYPSAEFRKPEDLAFLPYSSGTTGTPKGVEITNRNLVTIGCQTIHPDYNIVDSPTDTHQDVVPGILPLYHIYGFTLIQLHSLISGLKVVTTPKFTPDIFVSLLRENKISLLYAVPPLILFLTNHPDVKKEHLQHLKFLLCGAAPLGVLDEIKFKQKFGLGFNMVQGYGSTEASGIVTSLGNKKLFNKLEKYQGSSGPPSPSTTFKIVDINDTTGKPLGPNKSGEILIKAPQVMKGYLNKPDQTKEVFLDGWFKSGDIGYYNEDGMLYITDRLKEIIKVKGFQVAPAELEEVIRDHSSVIEAAVIGIPHSSYGEVPRAYVVKSKESRSVTVEDIQGFVADKLAKHKHLLGGVEFVDEIPKTQSGKIQRKTLKEMYNKRIF